MSAPQTPAGGAAAADFHSDEAFRRLVEGVQDYAIFMLTPQGHVATWNSGAQRIKGYRADEIIGQHFSKFYPAEALAAGFPALELQKASELGRFEDEGWRLRNDGTRFWANVIITAVRDARGELIGYSKITRDLTERRLHEERLRQSEENLRLLIDSVEDYAIFRLEADGTVASWNLGAQRIKGYAANEIIGQHFSRFYRAEEVRRGWPALELQTAAQTGRFEDEGWRVRKDGSLFWANVVITTIYDGHGKVRGYSKITRDLTERRRQEQRLKESEENLRLLVEGVKDHAVFMLDPEGIVLGWNVGAERVHGFRADAVVGRSAAILYTAEDIAAGRPQTELETARRVGSFADTGWRVRPDGSRFWADVTITVLREPDSALRGFAQITHDLSERRRVEELEIEGRRINEFIAMLAHELRNPLAPIANAVGILQKVGKTPELQRWTKVIDRQVVHLKRLVDDLLEISRITSGKIQLRKEPLDLGSIVTGALESVRPTVANFDHAVDLALPSEALHVDGDPTRLTQVVVNLLTNSAKYTPNRGRLQVRLERRGGFACLHVADNGIGMSEQLIATAFNLFVQGERALDRSEGGLGIGLTLVKRIVELHGGDVTATSAGPGKGTEMIVSLPLSGHPAPTAANEAQAAAPAAGRRILVVDDNVDAATSLGTLLRLSGHSISLAHDGAAALQMAATDTPDAVLLDLGLPGIDGYEVARRMREMPRLAHTRLIAMTGYGRDDDRRAASDAGFDAHLVKPVDLDEVLSAIDGARLGLGAAGA